jgi:nitroimidazol reductase NimA-like FMN-containing flavoprotein (pyridoxamine 5'-phosphate oxidase superfamily)
MTSPPSPRTTVRRHSERGAYDRETIHQILDEGLIGHVGFIHQGQPYVIPTLYTRIGDTLYFHGAVANQMLGVLATTLPVCVTVTLIDGLVLARSHFSHSANYRSVVILGQAREVTDRAEKVASFEALVEHVARGRWHDARQPTEAEIKATKVLALPIEEASAKVRTGPPKDDPEDLTLPIWAGVLPLELVAGRPIAAEGIPRTLETPAYLTGYSRGRRSGTSSER